MMLTWAPVSYRARTGSEKRLRAIVGRLVEVEVRREKREKMEAMTGIRDGAHQRGVGGSGASFLTVSEMPHISPPLSYRPW